MAEAFKMTWRFHGGTLTEREVGTTPPPFVSEAWIAACFKPEVDRDDADRAVLAYSDQAIAEIERADVITIATPMYNYGMPAQLKAWIDMVVRVNKTFRFDPTNRTWPLSPVLKGKHLVLLSASGEFAFEPGGIRESWNHLDPHLRTVAHYLGADGPLRHIRIEFQEFGDERHAASVEAAMAAIPELAGELATHRGANRIEKGD